MPGFHYRLLNAKVPTASRRQLARVAPPEKKPKTPTVVRASSFKNPRRKYNDGFKLAIVALRFGSLTTFDHPVRSAWSISKELNVNVSVVNTACANFKKHGRVRNPNTVGNVRHYSPEHIEAMVGDRALDEQKFMSLSERCLLLENRHDLAISQHGLRGVYKRHKVGFHFARTQTKKLIAKEPDTTNDRRVAAQQILSLVAGAADVVYVDETRIQVSKNFSRVCLSIL